MTYEFFENEVYSEVLERLGKDRTKIMEDFRIFVAVDEKHELYHEKQYEIMVSDAKALFVFFTTLIFLIFFSSSN